MASQPMDDKRSYSRFAVALDVKVTFADGHCTLKTRDISDGGVFLIPDADNGPLPPLGTHVSMQVQNSLLGDEPPPIVQGEVVRHNEEGIGIQFLEND